MISPARSSVAFCFVLACFGVPSVAADLTLLSDRPAYLAWVDMPAIFGHHLIRVTDPGAPIIGQTAAWGMAARHRYVSSQVWNADQSLLAVEKGVPGYVFLDGTSYRPLFQRHPPGTCEWHPVQPDVMICVDHRQVLSWDVRTDRRSGLFTTDAYGDLAFGPGKGNLSRDGRYIALRGRPDDAPVAFILDLVEGTKYPDISLGQLKGVNGYVTASSSGRYLVAWQLVATDKSGPVIYQTHIFARDGTPVQSWLENHRPGHGDLTLDADGSDIMVGVSKSDPDNFRVIKRRLCDGKVTVLTPRPGLAQHVSARNVREPGWVYVTYGGSRADNLNHPNRDPFYQEILAVRLDGSGETRRVTPTRSVRAGYLSEAHGSPSPDGSKIAFASNWGDPGGPVALYVADAVKPASTHLTSITDSSTICCNGRETTNE